MGPILAEFRDRRQVLIDDTYDVLVASLKSENRIIPSNKLSIKITAQGGVATSEEHKLSLIHI